MPECSKPTRRKEKCLEILVKLYEAVRAAEPGEGYADKAAEYRLPLETTEVQGTTAGP